MYYKELRKRIKKKPTHCQTPKGAKYRLASYRACKRGGAIVECGKCSELQNFLM